MEVVALAPVAHMEVADEDVARAVVEFQARARVEEFAEAAQEIREIHAIAADGSPSGLVASSSTRPSMPQIEVERTSKRE